MRVIATCCVATLVCCTAALFAEEQETRWKGFYDQETLRYWRTQTPPGIEENLREVIWPRLTDEERDRIGRVTLDFPLENGAHPMNFYADFRTGTIYLPISSMRFYGDVELAYSWLYVKDYDLNSVSEYLGMIKYRWPNGLAGKPHLPLEALGIPKNARDDKDVLKTYQAGFGTGMVFALSHELGHLYHRHPPYDPNHPETSQRQETEADEFGLEMMRRIGDPPLGIVLFFSTLAHLQSMPGDADHEKISAARTHPLNGDRLLAVSRFLEQHEDSFVRGRSDAKAAHLAVQQAIVNIREIGKKLEDPGVQDVLRLEGRLTQPDNLLPRKKGEFFPAAEAGATPSGPFDGDYLGDWGTAIKAATKAAFQGQLRLKRDGDNVTGEFRFGVGSVLLEGAIVENEYIFNWRWQSDSGKGILRSASDGKDLTGTWGYKQESKGAGTWTLHRK